MTDVEPRADVLSVTCRHCAATPGVKCRTRGGQATRAHAIRFADAGAGIDPADEPDVTVVDFERFSKARARKLARENGLIG